MGEMPSGGTPTHDAWMFGYETVNASMLDPNARKFVLLITDGAPTSGENCQEPFDEAAMITDVTGALTDAGGKIGTFVIGVPGSQGGGDPPNDVDARPSLSRIAEAGGTAPRDAAGNLMCAHTGPNFCHFDMTTATDLTAALIEALKKVTTSVISDTLVIPDPPPGQKIDIDTVEVHYYPGGMPPPQIVPHTSPCTDGWDFTDATQTSVKLCGPWRDKILADTAAKLVIQYNCEIISGLL
jgi:hypothetical protein